MGFTTQTTARGLSSSMFTNIAAPAIVYTIFDENQAVYSTRIRLKRQLTINRLTKFEKIFRIPKKKMRVIVSV